MKKRVDEWLNWFVQIGLFCSRYHERGAPRTTYKGKG